MWKVIFHLLMIILSIGFLFYKIFYIDMNEEENKEEEKTQDEEDMEILMEVLSYAIPILISIISFFTLIFTNEFMDFLTMNNFVSLITIVKGLKSLFGYGKKLKQTGGSISLAQEIQNKNPNQQIKSQRNDTILDDYESDEDF